MQMSILYVLSVFHQYVSPKCLISVKIQFAHSSLFAVTFIHQCFSLSGVAPIENIEQEKLVNECHSDDRTV